MTTGMSFIVSSPDDLERCNKTTLRFAKRITYVRTYAFQKFISSLTFKPLNFELFNFNRETWGCTYVPSKLIGSQSHQNRANLA